MFEHSLRIHKTIKETLFASTILVKKDIQIKA